MRLKDTNGLNGFIDDRLLEHGIKAAAGQVKHRRGGSVW